LKGGLTFAALPYNTAWCNGPDGIPYMRLTIAAKQAREFIEQIPHSTCTRAAPHRWHVADDGTVRAQSVLWLFCWGKTGMGSQTAAGEARRVFDLILPVTFDRFDALIDHRYARAHRYSREDIDAELTAILNREIDLGRASVADLLKLHAQVLEELRRRGIMRSSNNPVADYTEHLVTTKLGLTLRHNSAAGHDAVDNKGRRYQIKGRRLTPENASTELSAIRNLPGKPFDFLIGVVYRPDFTVDYAAQVPYEVVVELAKYSKHTNAYRFLMRRSIIVDARVTDVTDRLTA